MHLRCPSCSATLEPDVGFLKQLTVAIIAIIPFVAGIHLEADRGDQLLWLAFVGGSYVIALAGATYLWRTMHFRVLRK